MQLPPRLLRCLAGPSHPAGGGRGQWAAVLFWWFMAEAPLSSLCTSILLPPEADGEADVQGFDKVPMLGWDVQHFSWPKYVVLEGQAREMGPLLVGRIFQVNLQRWVVPRIQLWNERLYTFMLWVLPARIVVGLSKGGSCSMPPETYIEPHYEEEKSLKEGLCSDDFLPELFTYLLLHKAYVRTT